jgi:hypothetical protein
MEKIIDHETNGGLAKVHAWCDDNWPKFEKDYNGRNMIMFYPCCMAFVRRGAGKCRDHPQNEGEESLFDALRASG